MEHYDVRRAPARLCGLLVLVAAVSGCAESGLEPGAGVGTLEASAFVSEAPPADLGTMPGNAAVPEVLVRLTREGEERRAHTGADGRTRLTDLGPGLWNVEVVPPAGLAVVDTVSALGPVHVAGDTTIDLDLPLTAASGTGVMIVPVTLDGTQGWAGVNVTATSVSDGRATEVATDSRGLAFFTLPASLYSVSMEVPEDLFLAAGAAELMDGVKLDAEQTLWVSGFALSSTSPPDPVVTVTGDVVAYDGLETVPGTDVTFTLGEESVLVTSDQHGQFARTGLTPGTWTMTVEPPGGYILAADETSPRELPPLEAGDTLGLQIGLGTDDGTGAVHVQTAPADSAGPVPPGSVVAVRDASGTLVAQEATVSASPGPPQVTLYVAPGTYEIELTPPDGWILAPGEDPSRSGAQVRKGRLAAFSYSLVRPSG